ncbi:MAG TPA: alpha/beta hydrolase [Pyrinomonadaceae bacterium]|jgi:pimeloyl-ACP methyl ester carboxylesterase|nr:alpha/beta hydrolase [Pyrinomonadaceae bacterium]
MTLNDWRQAGKYFTYGEHPIFYRDNSADGEATLLLHGFPSSSFDYHKIWNQLSDKFPLLAYDMIGYGFSAKPRAFSYTTFDQADLLQELLENLRVKNVHILAHDYGNTITQELLARAEEKRLNFTIHSICMLNGALFPETHRPVLAQKILISSVGFLFAKLISDKKFEQSFSAIFGKDTKPAREELADFRTVFKYNDGKKIAHKLIRYMRERKIFRERWVGALQRTNIPFRFINGLDDPVSGAHLVARFREIMPQTDIVELPGIGHYPHFECPEKILQLYFEFREGIN